jgi:hypothetical protein
MLATTDLPAYYTYVPAEGGLRLRYSADPAAKRPAPNSAVGVVQDDPRLHRRPLFPPARKRLLWNETDTQKIQRCAFRPIVLAYMAPRFILDMYTAGGLCGHLLIGLATEGESKWLHEWSDVDVSYVYGRMEYTLRDPAFPGVEVALTVAPLADSVGLVANCEVRGLTGDASLVWMYGGASAFFTNYSFSAAEFVFTEDKSDKDDLTVSDGAFTLHRAFDKADSYLQSSEAINRYLPDWEVSIRGGSRPEGEIGLGDPNAVLQSPTALLKTVDWQNGASGRDKVAVGRIALSPGSAGGSIVIGAGGDIEQAIGNPGAAYQASLARDKEIADRVVTRTPDPYLDAANTMMAYLNEGTWGDCAILHGAWSWRNPYLGWRGWYGPDCYGWTDRIRASILNHIALSVVQSGPDEGSLGSMLYEPTGVFYNMSEVFTDHVRHYLDYTNDLEITRKVFPILEGVVQWEDRRLRPGPEPLYESALNTWISDSHWYIRGQCVQASAYMLGAWTHLAKLAARLGKDPEPYARRAAEIREALQSNLWLKREGVYAEYRDTLGNRLLHPDPELPTIYHSAEFGACDPMQIYQMCHWAETHLKIEPAPGGAVQYWSSNWFPNRGRSYTHSTYEMAYAEEFNFALTNYLAGREEVAYSLLRGGLCGIFNGMTPGGLSCHSQIDGRQRFNDEFADAISMWARMVMEGTFGIAVNRPEGVVELTPQLPSGWPGASIRTPHFAYELKRGMGSVAIDWRSPVATGVRLRLPLRAAAITSVLVDEAPTAYDLEAGFGLAWLTVAIPEGTSGTVAVEYVAAPDVAAPAITVREGDAFTQALPGRATTWADPQGLFSGLRLTDGSLSGMTAGAPGPGLLFLTDEAAACPVWTPVSVVITPAHPVARRLWQAPQVADKSRWVPVDVSAVYNAEGQMAVLERVMRESVGPALPASQIGFGYRNSHYAGNYVVENMKPDDAAWRAKIGPDGIGWTTDGIPFRSPKQGPNMGIVTLAAIYPAKLTFPVNEAGGSLYLMLTGITFAVQSHVVNLRVTLHYADGGAEVHDLVNPFDIGDCWATSTGRCHDTAATGFENLGGRRGPSGSSEVADLTVPIEIDTEANLVRFDLRPGQTLASVEIEAIANDVIWGVMGATLLR